eukprot:scaffold152731_cov43-Prasinocladus_malaysianus.AAC.1
MTPVNLLCPHIDVPMPNRDKGESHMLRQLNLMRLPKEADTAMPEWLRDNIQARIGRLADGPKLSEFSTANQ